MKVAIMESVVTSGGHEIDYDRMLVEELKAQGHQPEFYVPEGHEFKMDYGVRITQLPGRGVSYQGKRGLAKALLAAKREINRRRWYNELYKRAVAGHYDLLIFPTATYRYLRGLHSSPLLNTPVPTVFIIHGATPDEAKKLFAQARKVQHNPAIKIAVQTFVQELAQNDLPNLQCFFPPAFVPRDIEVKIPADPPEILKLGLFGQYRKEKNIDPFLAAYVSSSFTRPVKLIVQGATTNEADAADFERLINTYENYGDIIEFWHKPLVGKEWQEAIAEVDVVVMPYAAERYRFHYSAMLSTAVGFYKPVLAAKTLNPEVLRDYNIGASLDAMDIPQSRQVIENFVNTYNENFITYQNELKRANGDFSPGRLVRGVVNLAISQK